MSEHTPKIWKAKDGIVTELEVDAVRSFANAVLGFLDSTGEDGFLRGFFLGIARDGDDSLAMQIATGRGIRRDAGDEPLMAEFQKCSRCERPARDPDSGGVCVTCRAADAEEQR